MERHPRQRRRQRHRRRATHGGEAKPRKERSDSMGVVAEQRTQPPRGQRQAGGRLGKLIKDSQEESQTGNPAARGLKGQQTGQPVARLAEARRHLQATHCSEIS